MVIFKQIHTLLFIYIAIKIFAWDFIFACYHIKKAVQKIMLLRQILQCFFSVSSCILAPYRPKNTFVRQPTAVTPDFSISHWSKKGEKEMKMSISYKSGILGGQNLPLKESPPPSPRLWVEPKSWKISHLFFQLFPLFPRFPDRQIFCLRPFQKFEK